MEDAFVLGAQFSMIKKREKLFSRIVHIDFTSQKKRIVIETIAVCI